jgi:hypothetical protein
VCSGRKSTRYGRVKEVWSYGAFLQRWPSWLDLPASLYEMSRPIEPAAPTIDVQRLWATLELGTTNMRPDDVNQRDSVGSLIRSMHDWAFPQSRFRLTRLLAACHADADLDAGVSKGSLLRHG